MSDFYSEFVALLKKRYGKYDPDHHRFDKSSNSEIARELGYSDAQFSRLINGSATDGEYQRALQNLERILLIDKMEQQLSAQGGSRLPWTKRPVWLYTCIVLVLLSLYLLFTRNDESGQTVTETTEDVKRDATLQWAFETSYVKPYISLDDLPEDCNYPCYKYQGKWSLKDPYKLPFFREQNGYHYIATQVNMYARCMSEESETGDMFEGYEYQKHEIWYDKRELPVDEFMLSNGELKEDYRALNFSEDDNFTKVATVHTFFRNEFRITTGGIQRFGKVIGRDVELTPDEKLGNALAPALISKIKSNLNRIARNRLEDFSRPVSCERAELPTSDFNQIKDGDEMSYDCQLTTSRVAVNYIKTYVLSDQYIKNTCRPTE